MAEEINLLIEESSTDVVSDDRFHTLILKIRKLKETGLVRVLFQEHERTVPEFWQPLRIKIKAYHPEVLFGFWSSPRSENVVNYYNTYLTAEAWASLCLLVLPSVYKEELILACTVLTSNIETVVSPITRDGYKIKDILNFPAISLLGEEEGVPENLFLHDPEIEPLPPAGRLFIPDEPHIIPKFL